MTRFGLAGNHLPTGWQTTSARHLFRREKRTGFPDEQLLSVYRDYGVIRKDSRDDNFNKASEDLASYQLVEPNDLVINKMKAWQGSVGISEHRGIVSPAYFVAKPTTNFFRRYVHYLLRCSDYLIEYQTRSSGIRVNQWDLDWDDFRDIPIALPPLAQQTRIANFLDEQTARIDALIAEKERLSALLSISLESFIESAVLPKAGVCLIPLKRVSERIITGPFGSALHSSDYIEQGVPVINPSHITGGTLCPDANVSVSAETAEAMSAYRMTPGDVIVGRRGEMGRCAVVPQEGNGWLCGTGCLLVSPNPVKVMASYLQLVISSRASKEWLSLESVGSTMENLNGEIIGRLPGYFPHPREQRERVVTVGRAMTQHEALIRHVSEHIACLREYRSSLISAAVTGQLDIENFRREVVQT